MFNTYRRLKFANLSESQNLLFNGNLLFLTFFSRIFFRRRERVAPFHSLLMFFGNKIISYHIKTESRWKIAKSQNHTCSHKCYIDNFFSIFFHVFRKLCTNFSILYSLFYMKMENVLNTHHVMCCMSACVCVKWRKKKKRKLSILSSSHDMIQPINFFCTSHSNHWMEVKRI